MDVFISLVVEMKDLISQSEDVFGVKVLAEVDPDAIRQLANHLYYSEQPSVGIAEGSQLPVEA